MYKYVDQSGEVVYIGKTDKSLENRVYAHKKNRTDPLYDFAGHIYYAPTHNSVQTALMENYLINRHNPKYNVAKCATVKDDIPEPGWILFQ